jgi:hypothetical protein
MKILKFKVWMKYLKDTINKIDFIIEDDNPFIILYYSKLVKTRKILKGIYIYFENINNNKLDLKNKYSLNYIINI